MTKFVTKILVFGLLLSLQSAFASSFQSLHQFTPAPRVIDGISYPRNGMMLFRGTDENQMDLTKALRAMSGDKSAILESKYFSAVKAKLMGRTPPVVVPLSTSVERTISDAISKNGRVFDEVGAAQRTRAIMDDCFDEYNRNQTLISTYLDYRSSSYVDWPVDAVFTTIVSPVAATYGGRILMVRETNPRSLDLNYFNYVKNGKWYEHTRDVGEFVAHGYIPAEDIVGYQVRRGGGKSWHRIEFMLYKSKNQILIFSGERDSGHSSGCITVDPATDIVYHCDYRGGISIAPPPLTDEKPKLAGVLVLCNGTCSAPNTAEMQIYRAVDFTRGNAEVQRALDELKSRGVEMKFIKAD